MAAEAGAGAQQVTSPLYLGHAQQHKEPNTDVLPTTRLLSCSIEDLRGQTQQQAMQQSWAIWPSWRLFSCAPCQHPPC